MTTYVAKRLGGLVVLLLAISVLVDFRTLGFGLCGVGERVE